VSLYIAYDMDALKSVPDCGRAAGCPEAVIGYGLIRLWAHCWNKKTDQVAKVHLLGFFDADSERLLVALEAFGFIDPTELGYRVKGADRYLRIRAIRAKGGHAAKGNLKRGTLKAVPAQAGAHDIEVTEGCGQIATPSPPPGSFPAPPRLTPGSLPAAARLEPGKREGVVKQPHPHSPAQAGNEPGEHRTPSTESLKAAASSESERLWAAINVVRLELGWLEEKPPHGSLERFAAEGLKATNFDEARLVAAFRFWCTNPKDAWPRDNKGPWRAWIGTAARPGQWRKALEHVSPAQRPRPEARWPGAEAGAVATFEAFLGELRANGQTYAAEQFERLQPEFAGAGLRLMAGERFQANFMSAEYGNILGELRPGWVIGAPAAAAPLRAVK
jgi:hypothetical protein